MTVLLLLLAWTVLPPRVETRLPPRVISLPRRTVHADPSVVPGVRQPVRPSPQSYTGHVHAVLVCGGRDDVRRAFEGVLAAEPGVTREWFDSLDLLGPPEYLARAAANPPCVLWITRLGSVHWVTEDATRDRIARDLAIIRGRG
jgi:hypothetical protein